ncbi:hypothetical protein [Streptomyces formicae]|uniref:hypothetical protein n=1 Tax=Streptomyces formicae TaxID=1616117 RepID=UPI00131D2AD3|nr:hypothetical protein [Streptomyces formicae]
MTMKPLDALGEPDPGGVRDGQAPMDPAQFPLDGPRGVHPVDERVDRDQGEHGGYQLGVGVLDARQLYLQRAQGGEATGAAL